MLFLHLSVNATFPLAVLWFYGLLDCIHCVGVKGTLASCDIIFLGWTGRQKDKLTLLEVNGSFQVKSLEPYDCKDYFVRLYFFILGVCCCYQLEKIK